MDTSSGYAKSKIVCAYERFSDGNRLEKANVRTPPPKF